MRDFVDEYFENYQSSLLHSHHNEEVLTFFFIKNLVLIIFLIKRLFEIILISPKFEIQDKIKFDINS